MATTCIAEKPVGQLVREHPRWARVFDEFGIDYCCGGKISFSQACVRAGITQAVVEQKLSAAETATESEREPDWTTESLTALADHIVERHHSYLREALPRIDQLLERVEEAHGQNHPELHELRRVFRSLLMELSAHIEKEEQVLFPIVRQLEQAKESRSPAPAFHCGSVNNPIRVMEHEHDEAGEALRRMSELTNRYTPPADACETYRVSMLELAELEADLHEHIHKENNILFPGASALEASLA